jgi:hypothetical protein
MAIKFNKNKIRLWKGVSKTAGDTNIGIRFNKGSDTKEIYKIYKMVHSLLDLKYGKGVK